MNSYDFYLRHASVREGEWVGFPLAWQGLGGVGGLPLRPHSRWRPWLLDPDAPEDPTLGTWGVWQWRLDVALFDVPAGLLWTPPEDGRTPADMRDDLLLYMDLPAIQLKDTDETVYTAKMTAYQEQSVEPYNPTHPEGGRTARIELAEVAEA